jgi:hypothetical protein
MSGTGAREAASGPDVAWGANTGPPFAVGATVKSIGWRDRGIVAWGATYGTGAETGPRLAPAATNRRESVAATALRPQLLPVAQRPPPEPGPRRRIAHFLATAGLVLALAACGGGPILANQPLVLTAPPTPVSATAPPADPIAISLPRDDGPHDRLTEWWYYTGHLETADGRHFGFEPSGAIFP